MTTRLFHERIDHIESETVAAPGLLGRDLFGLGAIAAWADSEAVLPAYIAGMLLAGTVGRDHALIRRIRTLTLGLMTPFYFIRAGSFVLVPALIAAPIATHVVAGHPVRDIIDLARSLKADLLVVGARGHSALYERMIGSRADRIVHLAPCPVLAVK